MNVPATRPGFARWLGAIAVAGLAVRLLYVLAFTRGLRGHGDSAYYHELGNLLADGRGFVEPSNGSASALHPPLFPLLLALPSLVGLDSYLAHRVAVALVGTGTVVVAGLLGRRVAGDRAGLLAAVAAAAYPVLIAADGAVMSETLFGLLTALCALAAYRLLDRPTLGRAASLGALIGLAALTRGEGLLLLMLLGAPLAVRLRARRFATLAVATAACLAVLAPWTIRNLTTFEKPVLLSNNEGGLIAGANCARTYRGRDIGGWDIRCTFGEPFADESVAAARARRRGLEYAGDHAGRVPLVVAARLARTFELLQPVRQAEHAEGRAAGIEVAGAVVFLVLVPLGAYGGLLLRRRGVALAPLLAPFGLAVFATVVGYGVPRFRHPADVALVVLAAVALDALAPAGAGSSVASPRSAGAGGLTNRFSRSAGRSTT
jgi:4-amino-4-deoxy-L-arabinose transferase-like glycosyltransferase